MKLIRLILALVLLSPLLIAAAHAEVTLFNSSDWKVGLSGFLEVDSFYDTTRGFTEYTGSAPVPRKGTFNGDDGRTQFSVRNSRFAFNIVAPESEGWITHGVLEMDFLGYDPAPSSSGASTSESAFFANPTLRIRHAYFAAEKNDLQILVGQTWSLFGWQPSYSLASISVNPDAATMYERLVKLGAIKSFRFDGDTLQTGFSIERPTERDGKIPNLVAGIRFAMNGRKSGFAGPNSDIKLSPMSIGLSGAYRNYTTPNSLSSSDSNTQSLSAFAFAADTLIPILASSDGKDVSHTLSAVGEFTIGKGYGDEFPNWTGGVLQTFTGAQPTSANVNAANNNTNIDSGLGGYNSAGNFELLNLRTFNAQLQYHFEGKTFATCGYGQLWSSNVGNFQSPGVATTNGYAAGSLYDKVEAKFLGISHDLTPSIRVAVEFDQFTTHYVADGATNFDNRYMFASYFRF
jgi:hypothetical protein